ADDFIVHVNDILSHIRRTVAQQKNRLKNKAEVFTPAWICNAQLDAVDDAWKSAHAGDTAWQAYITAPRLEIACGEAPYLTNRYDAVSGEEIAPVNRCGILDRKLRAVSEHIADARQWLAHAFDALRSVYGFDWQGDNVYLARENLLCAFAEAYKEKFGTFLSAEHLHAAAEIVSWNVWQMDGISGATVTDARMRCKIKLWSKNETAEFASLADTASAYFDAIVGNPPYQIADGGARSSAKPIYHLFAQAAAALRPRYVSLILPARWYAGGKGLDAFRATMLADRKISLLVDYPDSTDCFPALGARSIKGGVCWYLRDSTHDGICTVRTMRGSACVARSVRYLKEEGCDIFIRDAVGASVRKKAAARGETSFAELVRPRKPFGLPTDFSEYTERKQKDDDCLLYAWRKTGYVSRAQIARNAAWADCYKLLVPEAIGSADVATDRVKPLLAGKGTCCTETYLLVGPFPDEQTARNCKAYMQTKFFHFLLSLCKITQHTTRKCYAFIPAQDFSRLWSDAQLYEKYGFTQEEQDYIETTVWQNKREEK
ncbi:MAG: Eco57I restriction-modification methylase domain-containing protein, partial [Clostridiales bacterium]|nr:Eco57I restriction-modification methylase domain-containing protein [Clostridiales bacterium]